MILERALITVKPGQVCLHFHLGRLAPLDFGGGLFVRPDNLFLHVHHLVQRLWRRRRDRWNASSPCW